MTLTRFLTTFCTAIKEHYNHAQSRYQPPPRLPPGIASTLLSGFGLLNIIVLGEVLLSSTKALEVAIVDEWIGALFILAGCGVVIAFSMWWLYFCQAESLESVEINRAFVWTYGHFFVFAAGAFVGTGLELMGEALVARQEAVDFLSPQTASLAITWSISLYIFGLWFVRDRYHLPSRDHVFLLFFAVLIALSGFLPYPPVPATVLLVACLAVRLRNSIRPS